MGRDAGGSRHATGPAVRWRHLLLLLSTLGSCLLFTTLIDGGEMIFLVYPHHAIVDAPPSFVHAEESYTIKTEGCSIPLMKPVDDTIKEFVFYPDTLKKCQNVGVPLLANNKTHIWVNMTNGLHYNISDVQDIVCCYRSVGRPDITDITSRYVDDRVEYSDCKNFTEVIEVENEFVTVACSTEKKVYEQYFLFAPKKEYVSHDDSVEMPENKTAFNVIVLGIDAVSRLNFHRTMPKTVEYLKSRSAIELLGYNKVGDNTFPNLVPLLMGLRPEELKKICHPYDTVTFDGCPFVWDWYKQAGYYTAFAEDGGFLGTFNYVQVGFGRTPTDYYTHTIMHVAEDKVGNNKDLNSYLCMGEKYFYKVLLDYISDVTTTLRSSKLFGLFWEMSMSHDYLNYPMIMDDDYVDILSKFESSGYLNDTIIFLISDHGIRWGGIRSTKQGRIEERLPFVFALLPPSFQKNYTEAYNHLKFNSKRLTTPFDMHQTLIDLVDLKNIEDSVINTRKAQQYSHERGISLFLPIPSNRTCAMAGIDDHWCTCHKSSVLAVDNPEAVEAAAALIRHLNLALRGQAGCARLALAQVVAAREMTAGAAEAGEAGWRELLLVARAQPGDGLFEATLRRHNASWALAGSVSRLNLYGNTSRCVHDYRLKLYCYCM